MKATDLPAWILNDMESLGLDKEREIDGGLIELEFWLHVVANGAAKHAADAKALADAVSKYRDQVQMLGTMGMVTSAMNEAKKPHY